MCFFKCIKDFFKKVKDEIIRINETTTEGDINAWEIIEEEFEGDTDFDDLLVDEHEVDTEPQDEVQVETTSEASEVVSMSLEGVDEKAILMIDKDNNVVGVYNNIKEILSTHQGFTYSGTYGCLRGRRQTYKGFLFRTKEDFQKMIEGLK